MSDLWRAPALPCLGAWTAGIAAATVMAPAKEVVGAAALWLAAGALCAAVVVRPAVVPVAVAAGLLGVVRSELPGGDPTVQARAVALAGTSAVVVGRVDGEPRPTAGGYQAIVLPSSIATPDGPRSPAGGVVALVRGSLEPGDGDLVQVSGRLNLPRDQPTFNRRAYFAQQGAYLEVRNATLRALGGPPMGGVLGLPGRIRSLYETATDRILPQPHAALLLAIVFGVRQGIPPRLRQDLTATGLVHLLVLSGLKVAVFARLVTGLLTPLLRRRATLPALVLIACYCLAGGATPAAVRASAMGGIAVVASHLGRPAYVWTSLAAVAAAMLAWSPDLIWDVGFQLSFAGTAALVLLTPGIEERLSWLPGWFREPFAVTCAAQVGTAPLMAAGFQQLSPVAPLSNAVVLPLLPLMVAGGMLIVPLAVVPALGTLAALPLAALLQYLEQVAALLARLPTAMLPVGRLPVLAGAAYYIALIGGLIGTRTKGTSRRLALAAAVVGPLLITVFEVGTWVHAPSSAIVLDVGNGQAVLLRGPSGALLVDGGPDPSRLGAGLGAHLAPWDRNLAGLVITGPGLGHVGGLTGFSAGVAQVLVPDGSPPGSAWRAVAQSLEARGAQLGTLRAGMRLELAGLRTDILAPDQKDTQPGQVAIEVVGPSHTFCDFTDLDVDQQTEVASRLTRPCDAALVPQGGVSVPALQAAARPGQLIFSEASAARLPRGLPPATITRTADEGDVETPL